MSELVEIVARAIDPDAWAEKDAYLVKVEKDLGRKAGYRDHDTFKDKASIDFALAALRAIEGAGYEVGPGWQPIETAPRDGSYVLLTGCNGTGLIVYGAWIAESPDEDFHGPGWSGTYEGYDMWVTPTHWRPLPGPPAFDAAPTVGGE